MHPKLLANNNKDLRFVTKAGFPFSSITEKRIAETQRLTGYDRVTKSVEELFGDGASFSDKYGTASKAIQGCAPNLVHSTDAALLLMTVSKCVNDYGVTNHMMIHDSFATTAADCQAFQLLSGKASLICLMITVFTLN